MIPKLLHFNYFWEPLPAWAERTISEWRAFHPTWEVRVHTALPTDMPAGVVAALEWPPTYRFKSDIVRYWIIATQGGVYADVDTRPIRPVDEVLTHDAFCCLYMNDTTIPDNFFIGGIAGHPFWTRAVERCQHPETWTYDAVWFGAANANGCDWLKGGAHVLPSNSVRECKTAMEWKELLQSPFPPLGDGPELLKHYRVNGQTTIIPPRTIRNGIPIF